MLPRPPSRTSRLTSDRPAIGRRLAPRPSPLGALALAGCQEPEPPAVTPPADPPLGLIRPGETIPYATLVEHLTFNTKSRMQLTALTGQRVRVRGPVGKVEPDGAGALVHLGTGQGSPPPAPLAGAG